MSKHFTRRDLIHAGCTIAGATLVPNFIDSAEAAFRLHGTAQAVTPSGLSGRNIINIGIFNSETNDYPLIDHMRCGQGMVSPYSSAFSSTAAFASLIDANGWPNNAAANGQSFGGSVAVPDPANFPGPYTLDFVGNGAVDISIQLPAGSVGTFTPSSPVNGSVTFNSGGTFQFTGTGGASTASVQITFSSTTTGPQRLVIQVASTGASGFFVKNLRFYRTAEAADLAAGKIWRSAWKQPLVNLCPSAIRFMNILGGNTDFNCRFENRTLPSNAGYGSQSNWTASPVYSDATGTNQFATTSSPTTANPKMPAASMVHGEIATIRFTNGFARATNNITVSSITNAANGVVTTAVNHGYNTGDVIVHVMPMISNIVGVLNGTTSVTSVSDTSNINIGMFVFGAGIQAGTTVTNIVGTTVTLSLSATISGTNIGLGFQSMKNLHLFPCTITVTGATTYQLNVNTTAFGPFFVNGTVYSCQYVTLQVGSGSDRISYPILFDTGSLPASFFGNVYLSAGDTKTFYFDKTIAGKTDGAGNFVLGAWMFGTTPFQNQVGHTGDYPIEVCVALINELNAMSPAHTIGMWMNIPCWGLSSMDPDYSSASDWAVNAIDVVMNPNSTVRTPGYSALGYSGSTQLNTPNLIVEYSNELWPSGTNDGKIYLTSRGIQRWGTPIAPQNNWQDLKALRLACYYRDVQAANPPGLSRIKFAIGLWGAIGLPGPGDFGGNWATVFGGNVTATPNQTGDWYTNDTLVTSGSWGRPIDNHDGVCPATYFDAPDTYYGVTTGTGTFTDDSAMFNGTDNSANGGGNYTGAANPTQAITNFVAKVKAVGDGTGQSIDLYANTLMPQYASAIPAGKIVLNYEGGTDWQNRTGATAGGVTGHGQITLTADMAKFSVAVINSSQWATAQVNFFNAVNAIPKCFMPSVYIWIAGQGDQRWAYCTPDSYATIAGTPTEGAALTVNSPVWIAMGNRNQALPI